MSKDIRIIIDSVGRYIVGEFAEASDSTLKLKNPVLLSIQPNQQTGQLHVQSFPLFFKEFLKGASKEQTTWEFSKSSIIVGTDLELDDRLMTQYENIVNQQPASTPPSNPSGDAKVVKLFD